MLFTCQCSKKYIKSSDWLDDDICKDHNYSILGKHVFVRNYNIGFFWFIPKFGVIDMYYTKKNGSVDFLHTISNIKDFESQDDYIKFILKYVDNYIFT